METIEHGGIKWTSIKNPDTEEINYVRKGFDVHPIILRELRQPTLHPKISFYDGYIFMVLRFPEYENGEIVTTEVDLLITKEEVITFQYETLESLDEVFKKARENPEDYFKNTVGYLAFSILDRLSEEISPILDQLASRVDKVEKRIFADAHSGKMDLLYDIAIVRRDVNDFFSILKPNIDVLDSAKEKITEMFGKEMEPYLNHLRLTYMRMTHVAEAHGATLEMLHDTNESIVSNNLNKIIKLLTIFSVIVFPLTLFAGIWGMNTINMPLVGHPQGFWIVMSMMGVATFIMLITFKLKKWI